MSYFRKLFICIGLLLAYALNAGGQVGFGHAVSFNDGWLFNLNDVSGASEPGFDDSEWRRLSLPHDWSIEGELSPSLASCTGYLPGGIGWYRKHFEITDLSERHYIYFEGVYNRSEVYLNGHLLGMRPNGYISFMYDMTPYLKNGKNVISVRVDHSRYADSRWYSGSGIYRDVWLVSSPQTHFAQWGTHWYVKELSRDEAIVMVETEIDRTDTGNGKLEVRSTLRDAGGVVVAKAKARINDMSAGNASLKLHISNPHLWDLKTPYLYSLTTELYDSGRITDSNEMKVGLRTFEFDADKGFALNGEWMKVKGVCIHHDAGTLGAVVPKEVWKRRLLNLKKIGANAIRMSHNPQAPVVYELCDSLGLLVMDEGSDEWEFPKRKWIEGWNVGTPQFDGSYDFFEDWIEKDIADMVRRDRNHPCIFLWSVGNEVDYPNDPYSHPVLDGTEINQPMFGGYDPEAPDAMRIGKIAKRLADCIRKEDCSRSVTGALAGVVMSNETEYPGVVDVVGYNYTEDRYEEDHRKYPDRVIYGSENGPGYDAWLAVKNNDYIFGQFIWTGIDYLGESGKWPSRGLNTGLLDFGGFTKPRGHFRASLWCEEPVAYIGTYVCNPESDYLTQDAPDIWNYDEGEIVRVVCYTNALRARLFLDGEVVGDMKCYDEKTGIIYWDLPYRSGELKVEAYNELDMPVAQYSIKSSKRPYSLRASADSKVLSKNKAVAHVVLEVLDEDGTLVRLADNNVTCSIEGPATLLGLEGSDNTDMGNYNDNVQRVHNGTLLAYVQTVGEPGNVTIRFSSPLLEDAEISIEVR